jgi:hypothetical protein
MLAIRLSATWFNLAVLRIRRSSSEDRLDPSLLREITFTPLISVRASIGQDLKLAYLFFDFILSSLFHRKSMNL